MDRRRFLTQLIMWMGGLITAGLGFLGGGAFLSPLWRKGKEDWAEVGPTRQIKIGVPVKVEFVQRRRDGWVMIEGRSSAWVVTPNGRDFSIYDPHCTHLGCPYRWDEKREAFLCPCHNGTFAIDGSIISGPVPRPLDRFPHKVVGGKLYIKPKAEKFLA